MSEQHTKNTFSFRESFIGASRDRAEAAEKRDAMVATSTSESVAFSLFFNSSIYLVHIKIETHVLKYTRM